MNTEQFVGLFSGLASVNRFSQYRLINPESVLEHSGMVALTTLILLDKLEIDDMNTRLDALSYALCHDVDEILTGDIPMPTKYATDDTVKMFDSLSWLNANKVDVAFGVQLAPYNSVPKEIKCIVKLADVLAVFYKCYQEIELFGNKSLISATKNLDRALSRRFDDLKRDRQVSDELDCFIRDSISAVISWRQK